MYPVIPSQPNISIFSTYPTSSKDISDAVVGSVSSCFDDGIKALVIPKVYGNHLSVDVLNDYAKRKKLESLTQKYNNYQYKLLKQYN